MDRYSNNDALKIAIFLIQREIIWEFEEFKPRIWKKVNRKVQEEPRAETASNPRQQEEEKKWYRLTCA